MKLRRLAYVLSSITLSLSSLFVLMSPVAHAASLTWTGTAGDGLFSSATNWSGNAVPVTGDTITFDATGLAANTTVTNDLGSGVVFAGVVSTGFNAGSKTYTITSSGVTPVLSVSGSLAGGSGLTLDTNVTVSGSTIVSGSVTLQATRHMTLASDLTINGQLYLSGDLMGSGNVAVAGGGLVSSYVANSWAGNLTIQAGGMFNGVAGSFGPSTNVITINAGGDITLCGFNGASLANPMTVGGSGNGNYGAIQAYSSCPMGGGGVTGPLAQANAVVSGNIILTADTKVLPYGLLKFNGAVISNAHAITLDSGLPGSLELAVTANGSSTANGVYKSLEKTTTVTVDATSTLYTVQYNNVLIVNAHVSDVAVYAGTLKGTGTVGVLTVSGGTVAPGQSPGVLNTGNLVFTGGSLNEEIGGTTAGNFDQLNVTGTVNLGSATTLNVSHWNGYRPVSGDSFVIINNDGADAVTGTFQGLPQGATVTVDNVTYTISYTGGTGNDVVLTVNTVTPVTAPNTGFAMLNNNSILTVVITLLSAAGIGFVARKQLMQNKKEKI